MALTKENVPETKVLAIASHVCYGFVGNTMATFVMQSLGCEVAAINTVHFSNHTGYCQVKGTKTSAEDIRNLYEGLTQSYLTDFDVLLSGYAPSAAAVEAVGDIAQDLQRRAEGKPGSFFWALDPVMGDLGRLYVAEDVVPAYKKAVRHADLILPNQFETETLSGIKIANTTDLANAITSIHKTYGVPHIIVTSVQLSSLGSSTPSGLMTVIGSTVRSDGTPRLFRVDIPALECNFNGTGDMFAALTVARLREAIFAAGPSLRNTKSWVSPDDVAPTDLPLAKSTEKVLSSMHSVLLKTMESREAELATTANTIDATGLTEEQLQFREHLRRTKAAEVRVIRNVDFLRKPTVVFKAQQWAE
ncbi:pyridoxal kinase, putative [Talaromyces stipitatus ATCC 10500]|uniref:pyridoxal kinase n=1 Tax=Talaromyces stipitatus (strain ATCC 10500 / CBS 375.48 / QM 6759 / NRRL 1006) TaxID=441959 RepID=B8MHE7_TALSN|nr:pyridoxal kinase, putative [Talaromyces stipitatus ATCC 10500]EED17126.1 pyridoxal kinase, putative [Talaromyces stipitatus ATCC 10500]